MWPPASGRGSPSASKPPPSLNAPPHAGTKLPVTQRLLLIAGFALLTSCATTRDNINDEALYRAQDKTFRPMGN
jgi:hypothetical protein